MYILTDIYIIIIIIMENGEWRMLWYMQWMASRKRVDETSKPKYMIVSHLTAIHHIYTFAFI